jgi:flagellar protein FliL
MAAAKKEEPADDKEKPEGEGAAGEGVDLPKKKIAGKKLILIIVAAVILLLGGAGAGLYFTGMLGGKEEATAEGEGHGGEHGEEAKADEHSGKPIYFEMPTILVNLTSTGRKPVYFKVRIQLLLGKEEDRNVVTENQPRIVDNFQTYLRELTAEELQGSAGLMRLREELLLRVNASVAPVVVKDLLFQEILPQ